MRPSQVSISRRILLTSLLAILATQTIAQGNGPPGNDPAPTSAGPAPQPGTSAPPATNPPPTNAAPTNAPSSGTSGGTSGGSTSPTSGPTSAGSSAGSSASSAPPTLTSATFAATNTASSSGTAPPLPTLSNVLPPPLIVPDTSSAPFMQHSNLPEGTVFICVGAVLGFLGLCVLAWRGLVAWSLHRSVKRAADAAYAPDSKSVFGWNAASSTGGYKSMYTDSNLSMEALSHSKTAYSAGGAGEIHGRSKEEKRASRMSRGHRTSQQPSNASNLFFSPTASQQPGSGGPGNRSSFLPSGFYASGTSAANNGSPHASFGGPPAAGYGRVQSRDGLGTPTPPDSPSLRAQSRPTSTHLRPSSGAGPGNRHSARLSRGDRLSVDNNGTGERRRSRLATSTDFSLNAPPTGRAPSMYLEDLFENHGHGPEERF